MHYTPDDSRISVGEKGTKGQGKEEKNKEEEWMELEEEKRRRFLPKTLETNLCG